MKVTKSKNSQPWSVKILEKLVKVGKDYIRPLDYVERGHLYRALGPMRILFPPSYFSRNLYRLKQKGLVVKIKTGPRVQIKITEKGLKYLQEYKAKEIVINKPRAWDGQWRLVIFDIPESKKLNRGWFRFRIKSLGFEQVQKSVWAHPYRCDQEIAALCSFYDIEDYVSVFEGKYKGDDTELRRKFGL